MDSATLQKRIYNGYAQAAKRIGPNYDVFRPASAVNPLQATKALTLPASFNAEDMKYGKPQKYGKATWYVLIDGTRVQVGDFLKGPGGTFAIVAMQQTLPILVIECNRVATIVRPQQLAGVGAIGYGGDTDANETPLMQGWPLSILQGTKGEKEGQVLPGDTRSPWWAMLLTAFAGVTLRSGDIVKDDLARRYVISSAELTELGWRLTAMQAQT